MKGIVELNSSGDTTSEWDWYADVKCVGLDGETEEENRINMKSGLPALARFPVRKDFNVSIEASTEFLNINWTGSFHRPNSTAGCQTTWYLTDLYFLID